MGVKSASTIGLDEQGSMVETNECSCEICARQLDFEIDDFLLREIAASNAVIFAGAGASTEKKGAAPHNLYVELAVRVGLDSEVTPFPDVAQLVSEQPDGRFDLLRAIQERFDYIDRFRDLRLEAASLYDELATMPYLNTFVTTNWDRLFEERCHAKPFVNDPDMRFWKLPRRKVLKLHGAIDDYSTLVITRQDYVECEQRLHKSLIGAKLKEILTTNTCIFIGYSLRDDDIKEIFSFSAASLGKFAKTHYFVSPHAPSEPLPAFVNHIRADGTHFLETIKSHMCRSGCFARDEMYALVEEELDAIISSHLELYDKYEVFDHPEVMICGAYQDGLIHGYKRILDGRISGVFSDLHELQGRARAYSAKILAYRKDKKYIDVAYFRGYQNALLGAVVSCLDSDDGGGFAPRYYHEGVGELTRREYRQEFKRLPAVHKAAFAECKKVASKIGIKPGIVFEHMPWG